MDGEPLTNQQLLALVLEIDDRGTRLTSREIDFIANLIDHDVKQFTINQAKMIRRIYRDRVENGLPDDEDL